MKNADLFKDIFGTCATEIWSMSEKEFLIWLNEDAEPKTGHWIKIEPYPMMEHEYRCSECYHETDNPFENYCSECGAKMIEPQESEDKE